MTADKRMSRLSLLHLRLSQHLVILGLDRTILKMVFVRCIRTITHIILTARRGGEGKNCLISLLPSLGIGHKLIM